MKKVLSLLSLTLLFITLSFTVSGCGGAKVSPTTQKMFKNQEIMYTQFNMKYAIPPTLNTMSNDAYINTTNYAQGIVIPVNSQVTLHRVNAKQFSFIYNGQVVIVVNMPKYTGLDISQLLSRYLSKQKVDLTHFSKLEMDVIENPETDERIDATIKKGYYATVVIDGYFRSRIEKGMSKEALLIARGYPPIHQTPSIKSDKWKYWEGGNDTITAHFKNNKVVEVSKP